MYLKESDHKLLNETLKAKYRRIQDLAINENAVKGALIEQAREADCNLGITECPDLYHHTDKMIRILGGITYQDDKWRIAVFMCLLDLYKAANAWFHEKGLGAYLHFLESVDVYPEWLGVAAAGKNYCKDGAAFFQEGETLQEKIHSQILGDIQDVLSVSPEDGLESVLKALMKLSAQTGEAYQIEFTCD